MITTRTLICLPLLALLITPATAYGDPRESLEACLTAAKTLDVPAIQEDCSAAINADGLSPSDLAMALNARGLAFMLEKNYPLAIIDFSDAIRLEPENAGLYGNRSGAYVASKQYELSIADSSKAIALRPDSPLLFSSRSVAYIAMGKFDAAIQDLDRAIELKPDYAQAYANRGSARQLKGDPDGAITDLNKALSLAPSYGLAYTRRAEAYLDKGDSVQAEADCRKALELHREGNQDLGYDLPGHSFHCAENGPIRSAS